MNEVGAFNQPKKPGPVVKSEKDAHDPKGAADETATNPGDNTSGFDLPSSYVPKIKLQYAINLSEDFYNVNAHESLQIQSLVLESDYVPPVTPSAIGTVKNGALYIAPLTALVRMDPDFSRVDDALAQDDMCILLEEDEVVGYCLLNSLLLY